MRFSFGGATLDRDLTNTERLFRELPTTYQRRVIGPALLAMARVLRDGARATGAFDDQSGQLRRSIRAGRYKSRRGLPPAAFVEARQPYALPVEQRSPYLEPAVAQHLAAGLRRSREVFNERTVRAARQLITKFPTSARTP